MELKVEIFDRRFAFGHGLQCNLLEWDGGLTQLFSTIMIFNNRKFRKRNCSAWSSLTCVFVRLCVANSTLP